MKNKSKKQKYNLDSIFEKMIISTLLLILICAYTYYELISMSADLDGVIRAIVVGVSFVFIFIPLFIYAAIKSVSILRVAFKKPKDKKNLKESIGIVLGTIYITLTIIILYLIIISLV